MKKYLVIGNPIKHSLSPKLQNYWIKKNNLDAYYESKLVDSAELSNVIKELADDKISGANVTVPFKNSVIPFLDKLTPIAKETGSVNTIYKKDGKTIGDNTDVVGFESALRFINYNAKDKIAFILGAGGVAPSIISSLKKMGVSKIILSNRTRQKAEALKEKYADIEIVNWGQTTSFDIIINSTSLGLKKDDVIEIDYAKVGPNKMFYDVIYNPGETRFLKTAKEKGNQIENGKMMFAFQAQSSFKIWHNIEPEVDDKVLKLLKND